MALTDWNDLHCVAGIEEVRRQLLTGMSGVDSEWPGSDQTERLNEGQLRGVEAHPDCFKLDGALDEVYRLVLGASRYPQPPFVLAAALVIVSVAAGSRFKMACGTRPNIYAVTMGHSGCGKEDPVKSMKKILELAGLSAKVVADNIGSGPGLEDRVAAQPVCLVFVDEYGMMLKNNLPGAGGDNGVLKALTELYSKSGSVYLSRALAGKKSREIRNPTVSIFGSTTAESLHEAVTVAGAENGFLSRNLFFPTHDRRPTRQKPKLIEEIPKSLRSALSRLASDGDDVIVQMCPEANSRFNQYMDRVDETLRGPLDPVARAGLVRRGEACARLLIIRAVSRSQDDPVILKSDVDWAVRVVNWSFSTVFKGLLDAAEENEGNKNYSRLVGFVKRAKSYQKHKEYGRALSMGIMPRRLLQNKMKITATEFSDILESALAAGSIDWISLNVNDHGSSGRGFFVPAE